MRKSASGHLIRCLEAGGVQDCFEHYGQLSLSHRGLRIGDHKGYLWNGFAIVTLIKMILNDGVFPSAVFPWQRCLGV